MPEPTQSRREFLGTAAVSVAARMWAGGKLNAAGACASPGPNEQITVGVVGVGVRGNQLIRNIANLNGRCRVLAICDVDARRIAETRREHHTEWTAYEDYRKLIDKEKDLNGLVICTPHHQHVLPAMLACQAGLDVYVEKPLSNYVKEGRELVKAARKYGRVVQVGSQQRTMEIDRFACEFVRDGHIGQVQRIEAVNFAGPRPIPAEGLPEEPVPEWFNWDLFLGPAPVRPFNRELALKDVDRVPGSPTWAWWRDYSGAGTDLFAHSLDMVQYAMGADDTGPVEFWPVEGTGRKARIDFRYADGTEVRCRFPQGQGPRLGAVFTGTDCKMEINRNKFTTNPPDFVKHPPDPSLAAKWEGDGWVAQGHIENWLDCIASREKPNADVEIGHRTVTIGHLINIAREVNRKLRWDPAAEQIIGDAEANALLDRPRRKGWELSVV